MHIEISSHAQPARVTDVKKFRQTELLVVLAVRGRSACHTQPGHALRGSGHQFAPGTVWRRLPLLQGFAGRSQLLTGASCGPRDFTPGAVRKSGNGAP